MRGGVTRVIMMAHASHSQNGQSTSRPVARDRSPDTPRRRSGCCTGFLCLGSLKRGKRIVPATRLHDGSNSSPRPWASNGSQQPGQGANQYATHSHSPLAPPSSPASFQNSAVQSSAQSPCAFPLSMGGGGIPSQSPLESTQTMFQTGPYAHETALVSPPVFSTFTTAPSTAPFTPPPELAAHMTTPPSPEVPFAQLLANSFGTKAAVRLQPPPTYSASPFASPDVFAADDLQAAYQLYPGSPLAHLLSPASGTGASTPFPGTETPNNAQFTPFQDLDQSPVQTVANMFFPGSPLVPLDESKPSSRGLEVGTKPPPTPHPGSPQSIAHAPMAFPNGSNASQDSAPRGGDQQHLSATISSFLACGGDRPSGGGPQLVGYADFESGERLIVGVNHGSDGFQKAVPARSGAECATDGGHHSRGRSQEDESQAGGDVLVGCRNKPGEFDSGISGLVLSVGVSKGGADVQIPQQCIPILM